MEIHAPHQRVESLKDVLVHLAIVTIGILIALGLEGIVEWQRHKELAAEARANIRSEIKENRGKLADLLKDLPRFGDEQTQVIRFIENILAHRPNKTNTLSLSWRLTSLLDSSWATAQSVGAVSFLPYRDVKKFAEVYELQTLVVGTAVKGQEQINAAIGSFAQDKDPALYTDWELKAIVDRVQQASGSLIAEQQMGKALLSEYDDVLKEK
jgi:hypothetical protein